VVRLRIIEPMKSLRNAVDKEEILTRLGRIQPGNRPRWGKMSAPQMICHVSDAFRMFMGERKVTPAPAFVPRKLLRWVALWVPLPWPHGFPAVPELNQQIGGTGPTQFEADLRELRALIGRFTHQPRDFNWQPHPHFGSMREVDWMRLGYLHTDHHLRQFGA
jgi:Protein of unknown function (DUF1569)